MTENYRDEDNGQLRLSEEKHAKTLVRTGFGISGLYLLVLLGLAIASWPRLWALSPNEFGDLLAGAFSPLAFLWLVIGFFQQGRELRANVRALEVQAAELNRSVAQQQKIVALTQQDLDFQAEKLRKEVEERERTSRPIFKIEEAGSSLSIAKGMREYSFRLDNFGKGATDVELSILDGDRLFRSGLLNTGDSAEFSLDLPANGLHYHRLQLRYVDARGLERIDYLILAIEDGAPTCGFERY